MDKNRETDVTEAQSPRAELAGAGTSHSGGKMSGATKVFIVAVVAVVGVAVFFMVPKKRGAASAVDGKKAEAGRAATGPVPVVAGKVVQRDVTIYLDGLGTVQAFNTVTIRARVDGQLQQIDFVEGQEVREGTPLARIDPAPFQAQVAQAEAKKAQDEAQLANAIRDLKREAELLADKISSQQVYDTQKSLVDQFAATVKADQAAVDSARVQLNYTTIVSPIDGRIGVRLVDKGNIVHASDPTGLVVVTQLRPISVVFTLPEQNLARIHEQTPQGELSVVVVDRDNKTILGEGKLTVIDNQIDTSTGTIRLKATLPNKDLRLWPGQFVNVRLLVTTHKRGLVVPASVIQRGPDGPFAFVIKSDQSVQVRPLKVSQIEGGEALIDEGLRAGEMVVVDGQYKLQNGSKVKVNQGGKTSDDETGP